MKLYISDVNTHKQNPQIQTGNINTLGFLCPSADWRKGGGSLSSPPEEVSLSTDAYCSIQQKMSSSQTLKFQRSKGPLTILFIIQFIPDVTSHTNSSGQVFKIASTN